jgi:hypothetical protein
MLLRNAHWLPVDYTTLYPQKTDSRTFITTAVNASVTVQIVLLCIVTPSDLVDEYERFGAKSFFFGLKV